MKLKVEGYSGQPWDYYACRDERGKVHRLDLIVNGDFKKGHPVLYERSVLVGKTIEVDDYLTPFLEIATDVKVLGEE